MTRHDDNAARYSELRKTALKFLGLATEFAVKERGTEVAHLYAHIAEAHAVVAELYRFTLPQAPISEEGVPSDNPDSSPQNV